MNSRILEEKQRILDIIGPADPYLTKTTIGIHEVLEAHFLLVEFFDKSGEGLGGVGPKSMNLLHSALSRQFVEFGGKTKWENNIYICATLVYGLVKNHPFHDSNKRTAFLTSILHLQKIGRTPTATDKEYEDFIVDIANNDLDKYLKNNDERARLDDVEIISLFLKKKTRKVDLQTKVITYNELDGILRKRQMKLINPKGNRIDVVRTHDLYGVEFDRPKRIAHIGFQGWSKEISRKDIDILRSASKLDARHGYDSQSFFNGVEGPLSLIRKYKEPLERLAFR